MAKPYEYPGILGERPEFTLAGIKAALRPNDKAAQQADEHEESVRHQKALDLLAIDCGIAPTVRALRASDWKQIALTLAGRHVPAFMAPAVLEEPLEEIPKGKRRGRPSNDWDDELLAQMDALIAKGLSEREAAKRLKTTRMETPAAIAVRYRRMKRMLDDMLGVLEWMREIRQAT